MFFLFSFICFSLFEFSLLNKNQRYIVGNIFNKEYDGSFAQQEESATNLHTVTTGISKESTNENVTEKAADLMASDSDDFLAETVVHSPRNVKKSFRRKHPKSLSSPLRKNQQKGSSCGSPAKRNKVLAYHNR